MKNRIKHFTYIPSKEKRKQEKENVSLITDYCNRFINKLCIFNRTIKKKKLFASNLCSESFLFFCP